MQPLVNDLFRLSSDLRMIGNMKAASTVLKAAYRLQETETEDTIEIPNPIKIRVVQ